MTNIPIVGAEGTGDLPTIEIMDRTLCPRRTSSSLRDSRGDPPCKTWNWPWQGKFVTRVIYLEDPHNALPTRSGNGQSWFDVAPGRDVMTGTDKLGQARGHSPPRRPRPRQGQDPNFCFGSPPWVAYPPLTAAQAKPLRETPPARPAAPAEKPKP